MVEFERTDGNDIKFVNIIKELDKNLYAMYNNNNYQYDVDIQVNGINTVVLASIREITIGGGCFKELDPETAEVKRMFVNPYFRGLGVASGILDEIVLWARELRYKKLVLETGELQEESINLFMKHGFARIENFGVYKGIRGSVCMGLEI